MRLLGMWRFVGFCLLLALCVRASTGRVHKEDMNLVDDSHSNTRSLSSSSTAALEMNTNEEEHLPPLPHTVTTDTDLHRPSKQLLATLYSEQQGKKKKKSPSPKKKSPPPKKINNNSNISPGSGSPATNTTVGASQIDPSTQGRPIPLDRNSMCKGRNLMSKGIVGGRRYGIKYYQPCANTVNKSSECCEQCQAAEGCQGWFFTRLDCSAFAQSTNAGVCYLLADALLAYQDPDSMWAGGTQWTADQSGWNLAQDWDGGSAIPLATGQRTDSFELEYR